MKPRNLPFQDLSTIEQEVISAAYTEGRCEWLGENSGAWRKTESEAPLPYTTYRIKEPDITPELQAQIALVNRIVEQGSCSEINCYKSNSFSGQLADCPMILGNCVRCEENAVDNALEWLQENEPQDSNLPEGEEPGESYGPDVVNHPEHYTNHPSGVECIQVTRHMGFNLGNVFKYVWRADLKGKAIEDLEKAQFYLADEIQRRKYPTENPRFKETEDKRT